MPGVALQIVGGLFGVLLVVLGGLAIWRTASNSAWRQAAEGWKARTEEREAELRDRDALERELRETIAEQALVIQRLEQLPNLERVVDLMAKTFERIDRRLEQRTAEALEVIARLVSDLEERLNQHEQRSQERHEAGVRVLGAIESRLKNGGSR